MKIVSVKPRDIYVTIEMSLKQLEHVLEYIHAAKLIRNNEGVAKDISIESDTYVRDDFYKNLSKLYDEVKDVNVA